MPCAQDVTFLCSFIVSDAYFSAFANTCFVVIFFASATEEFATEALWLWLCHSAVRPCVNIYSARRNILLLSGEISMKLGTNIHHASANSTNDFQGHG